MALRWTAAAVLEREQRLRRISGYRDCGSSSAPSAGTPGR